MSATLSLIRWAGGKAKQLRQLLPYIPEGDIYCEPFGGGAALLLNKPRSNVEVYNDLDASLVNLFSVVRNDEMFDRFARMVGWVPYSRKQFEDSRDFGTEVDPVLAAVKFYTVLNQSISGKRLATNSDWSRARMDNVADRWVMRQEKLGLIHDRLRTVQVECRDALDILKEWDGPGTVFYCDPPYVLDTRGQKKYYAVEPGDEYHVELVAALQQTKGMVVLSGYDHPIYNVLTDAGWAADSYAQDAKMTVLAKGSDRDARQEIIWRNPACVERGIMRPLSLDLLGRKSVPGTLVPAEIFDEVEDLWETEAF